MTPVAPSRDGLATRYAWLLLAGLAVLLAAGAGGMIALGYDQPITFEADTGVTWSVFAADYPTVATLLALEDLLLGTAFVGFALLVAIIAATKYRAGERWAWSVLWLFPAVLLVTSALMVTHDQAYVAVYYIVAAAIAVIGLVLPARRFLA